mgnify:CR=1 FL=1
MMLEQFRKSLKQKALVHLESEEAIKAQKEEHFKAALKRLTPLQYSWSFGNVSIETLDDLKHAPVHNGKTLEECWRDSYEKKCVEDTLSVLNEQEKNLMHRIFRTAANLSMVAVNNGHEIIPDDYTEKLKIKLKNCPPSKRHVNELELLFRPVYLQLHQKIQLFGKSTHYVKSDNKTGRKLKPHWRLGHWRSQRYGEKLSLTKMIFIPAVFVNIVMHSGDMSETAVEYTA